MEKKRWWWWMLVMMICWCGLRFEKGWSEVGMLMSRQDGICTHFVGEFMVASN